MSTLLDVAPIVAVLVFFQVAVIRRRLPNLRRIVTGSICVLFGLALFLIGLEEALFPIGETMARQLTSPETIGAERLADGVDWNDYLLVYAFAAAIGFATTVAEPSLIAVALKAEEVSGGAVRAWGLRIAVAIGVSLGCFRIVTGTPLPWYIMAAYVIVIIQTFRASRIIIPLGYDSGGVTTSTVTVPVVAALGLGPGGQRPRPQPPYRWVRTHCLRQRLPHNDRVGLRHYRRHGSTTGATPRILRRWSVKLSLIVALVNDFNTDVVINAARAGGATGATVITSVRGEGLRKERTFFGLDLAAKRDVVLFLVAETRARDILERIRDAARVESEHGAGIAFQLSIEDAVGLNTQIPTIREELEYEI